MQGGHVQSDVRELISHRWCDEAKLEKEKKMHSATKASAKAHTGGVHLFEVQQQVASLLC